MEALPEPEGGDQNRAGALLAIFFTPFVFTVAVIGARFMVRYRLKNLGLEDYCMFFAWLLYTISVSLAAACMTHGGARHLYYLHYDELTQVLKFNYVSQPFGACAGAIGKVSVGLLVLKIIGPNTFWRKWFIYVTLAVFLPLTIVSVVFTFAQCTPSKRLWDPILQPKCWKPDIATNTATAQAAYGAFLDFALALLPVSIIYNLNMSLRKKLGLCAFLGLGVFTGICAAIKTSQFNELSARQDFTWATYDIFAWSSLEIALVIICGSIPTLKPLFDNILKGTPVKPKRSSYNPSKNSYPMKSGSNSNSQRNNAVSTSVTSTADDYHKPLFKSDATQMKGDIHVEHHINVDSYGRDASLDPAKRSCERL